MNALPPPLDHGARTVERELCICGDGFPSLRREDARDGLEEIVGEVFPSDILDRVEKLIDAGMRGVEGCPRGGQNAEVIIQLRPQLCSLLRFRGLTLRWRGRQLLNLVVHGTERTFELLPERLRIRAQR